MDKDLFLRALYTMAQHGTAPAEGCKYFGVGYENVFEAIRQNTFMSSLAETFAHKNLLWGHMGQEKHIFCAI